MTGLVTATLDGLGTVVGLVAPLTVYPSRGNGFAASIVAALMAVGLLVGVAWFATSKPKNRRRPRPRRDPRTGRDPRAGEDVRRPPS
jgi:hypothetical protein